jgi:sec-independent protein translocase protein TatA
MVPNIGPLEIAIVLIIALLVFGPKKLPDLGRSLGRGISEFREGLNNIGQPDDDEDDADEAEPAELTPPPADEHNPLPGEEPEVTEVTGEVVPEKKND